ncbi:hypothetical protein E2C01_020050 [Portunus trituberculatus]|uniref:Uncharacterized protein n=1 Tax=Portunus trituberculatus TaxID=210409 RepID=A0A5B7DZI3_PORTR|nr:hypothetical protein [Portunus trituberculatus]
MDILPPGDAGMFMAARLHARGRGYSVSEETKKKNVISTISSEQQTETMPEARRGEEQEGGMAGEMQSLAGTPGVVALRSKRSAASIRHRSF